VTIPLTGGADDEGPEPVVGSATQATRTQVRPLLGYLRVAPAMADKRVEDLRRAMADFASSEGFVLERVLVDQSLLHTKAFVELVVALERGDAAHVVVPALHHLAHFPSVQLAMKELLEAQTGARVMVMHSEAEEPA
jgi:hypothetical protein